jgi:hypothetical protein
LLELFGHVVRMYRSGSLVGAVMNEHRIGYVGGVLAGVILIGGIIARTLFTPRADHEININPVAREDIAAVPKLMAPIAQRTSSDKSPADGSQSNVLELPSASLDFVGYWGGYTHSTIFSVVPGEMTGESEHCLRRHR